MPSFYISGKGTPTRHVLGKSKMILGLLEGIPTMLKGEVAMVIFFPELGASVFPWGMRGRKITSFGHLLQINVFTAVSVQDETSNALW